VAEFDRVIRGGTIIDGLRTPRFVADENSPYTLLGSRTVART